MNRFLPKKELNNDWKQSRYFDSRALHPSMSISQFDERLEGDTDLQPEPKQRLLWTPIVSKSDNPSLVVAIAQAWPGLRHPREAKLEPQLSFPEVNPQQPRKIKGLAS